MMIDLCDTLLPFELDVGEAVDVGLAGGASVAVRLVEAGARILFTTLPEVGVPFHSGRTFYAFFAVVEVGGECVRLEREVPTWRSFYEPWRVGPLCLWLDAVREIFAFLEDSTGDLAPKKAARLVVHAGEGRICPEPVHLWCSLRSEGLRIGDCYSGENCWLGPYHGAVAHGGLDINHRAGMPLVAPITISDHYLVKSVARGDGNTCWLGHRRWNDGREWMLECQNIGGLSVREHTPLNAGKRYAHGAGVNKGSRDHTHFSFSILRDGVRYSVDPWMLFWQAKRDLQDDLLQHLR